MSWGFSRQQSEGQVIPQGSGESLVIWPESSLQIPEVREQT